MTLKERLRSDIKEAMKAGDAVRRLVLGLLQSAIKNKELEKRSKLSKTGESLSAERLASGSELADEEIMDVIVSETKKRKESIASYEKGGREELAQKERDELAILMEYMPEQMSEDRIREEIKKTIAETEAKDVKEMGKVLGMLMPRFKSRADGQTVSRIVKEELQK